MVKEQTLYEDQENENDELEMLFDDFDEKFYPMILHPYDGVLRMVERDMKKPFDEFEQEILDVHGFYK